MKLKNTREIRKIAKNSSILMIITLFVVGIIVTFLLPAVLPSYVLFIQAMGIVIIPLTISIGFNSAVGKMDTIMRTIKETKGNITNAVEDNR